MTRKLPLAGIFVALLLAAAPSVAQAADGGDRAVGVWLATSDPQASAGGGSWGRLVLQDGTLTFRSMNGLKGWAVDLTDARRIEISKTSAKALEIESLSGETFYVAILNGQMLMDSPRKALQVINRAMLNVPAESVRLAANAPRRGPADEPAAAPAPASSAKVVRVDGGQIR